MTEREGCAPTEGRPRLLMHVCCGPCAEWPLEALRDEGFAVDAYFYNPNIHPRGEWAKRLDTMRLMAERHRLRLFEEPGCEEALWLEMKDRSKSEHCRFCYERRLNQAALFAAAHGYSYLATSLQVSPYQNQELIASLARAACERHGITFADRIFSTAYRRGQEMAKDDGLYRQKYCGCLYSLGETREKYRAAILADYGLSEADIPRRRMD